MSRNLRLPDDDYVPPYLSELTHQTVTVRQYLSVCRKHRKLSLELTSGGELIILPFKGAASSARNANLIGQLGVWAQKDGSGVCFSSIIATLSNGARRIADVAWAKHEKYDRLTKRQKEGFGSLCPDFVVHVFSPTESLAQVCDKMSEYTENGVSLGWLIDPHEFRVYVYKPGDDAVILESPKTVSADPLLPGFTLDLIDIWQSD